MTNRTTDAESDLQRHGNCAGEVIYRVNRELARCKKDTYPRPGRRGTEELRVALPRELSTNARVEVASGAMSGAHFLRDVYDLAGKSRVST